LNYKYRLNRDQKIDFTFETEPVRENLSTFLWVILRTIKLILWVLWRNRCKKDQNFWV